MRHRLTRFAARALPVVGLVLGIALILFCGAQWWYLRDAVNDGPRLQRLLSQGKAEDYISAKLDLYNRRADDTRSLLVYLLAIGGFITTLQGLFAYFNVQNFMKQADDAMKKLGEQGTETVRKLESQGSEAVTRLEIIRSSAAEAESKAQERLLSIEAKLPVFTQMDRVVNEAIAQLHLFFSEPDTLTDFFETISPIERHRITYYERSVAGLEFTELPKLNKSLANIYRGLAIFYASKAFKDLRRLEEKQWNECPAVERIRNKDDLSLARLYCELARRKSENPFCVENDLGWIASVDGNLPLAAEHCRRSLALHPNQQRALTNLAIVQLKQGDLGLAIASLRQAKQFEVWETDRRDLKSRVCYNLACTLVRMAEKQGSQTEELLAEAFRELQEMLKYSKFGLLEFFDKDLMDKGDLWLLKSTATFAPGLATIREALAQAT